MKVSRNKVVVTILAGVVLVLFLATVAGLFYYREMIRKLGEVREEVFNEYPRLYAYIADDPDSQLSNRIYKEISEYAVEHDCYVEMTGQNLSSSYSKADRMNIAISSKVDGIILEGDDSEETARLVDKATANGIPVVTVLTDCQTSSRKSFVGLNNYSLGSEYGDQLAAIGEEQKKYPLTALILLDRDDGNADDIIHAAIQQAVVGRSVSFTSAIVDTSSPFTSEESIMNIIDGIDKMPDVIICLNDRTTESAIQCVVEKNLVGKTTILGYYSSDTILKAIDRGSVYATFTIETKTVARQCVNALNEYNNTGFVSEYNPANYIMINRDNVADYEPEDKDEG